MVLRQSLARPACRALRSQQHVSSSPASRRGLAAQASGSFQYQTGEAGGVKYATRDLAGPTATVALVSKAGTRYQALPGLAEGLQRYAFLNTHRRSALRMQREAELFGATLFSDHTRESIIVGAKFFRDDLPYFLEAIAEVATQTKYLDYEFTENVMGQIHYFQEQLLHDPKAMAIESAHAIAFHRGLGEPVHPTSNTPLEKYISHDAIGAYSTLAYRKENVAVIGNGAQRRDMEKYVNEFFGSMRTEAADGVPPLEHEQSKYFGGEERIAHANGNCVVLAFPGSSSMTGGFYKPEMAVLAQLFGGRSAIKWSPGFSLMSKARAGRPSLEIETKSAIYSDAGLLYTAISGPTEYVRDAAFDAVSSLRQVAEGKLSTENFQKARAQAQFKELEYGQQVMAGLELTGVGLVHDGKPYQLDESAQRISEVTESQVKEAARDLFAFKASVSSVGDLFQLPYAAELGLTV